MKQQSDATDCGWAAIKAGLFGNLMAVATSASILIFDPPGSEIRPMHLGPMLILIALGTALASIPLAIMGLFQKRNIDTAIMGLVLGMTPLATGLVTFILIVCFFGYTLKE
jgi:hypothetical protein